MNPTWAIVLVNSIALFVVPFFTYRYAHKNNLKTLREKWLSNVRDAASALVGACDKLYYANDVRYQSLSGENKPQDSERKALIRRAEEAQAEVTAASSKLRLLFREDSKSFEGLKTTIDALVSSVDKPASDGNLFHMDASARSAAQERFLLAANSIIQTEWKDLSET